MFRMTDTLHDRLLEARERKFRLNKAERRRDELQKRKREQERLIVELEVQLEAEQADVEQLTRLSLANLFHTLLRSKEEQLEMERQQALAAALKLQEAKQALGDTQAELHRAAEEIGGLLNAERDYVRLLAEKEAALRSSPGASSELEEMEARLTELTLQVREIDEARSAGRSVLASLEDASNCLEKAENWGRWDLWGGGGMISTHLKHGHVDDAKQYIHNANRLMLRFRDELADLNRRLDIEIDIGGMLKMADYWFDGLIADWVVQGRIQNAQEQTLESIRRIRPVVDRLQAEQAAAESELAGLKTRRVAWIEGKTLK